VSLPYREPMDFAAALELLRMRALPSIEIVGRDTYTRTLATPHGAARFTVGQPTLPRNSRRADATALQPR
jgi:AlkA N-terminal domain